MKDNIYNLNNTYSTSKLCYKLLDDKYLDENGKIKENYKFKLNFSEFNIVNSKIPAKEGEKFDTYLFLPEGKGRKDEGGLRTKGYFKFSYEKKDNEWYIVENNKLIKKVNLDENIVKDYEKLPLISIITVVFNGEKCLEETIQSVINQTYPNVEYMIIDGGSTDGTIDIIKKYEDKIDYWVSEKDNGIYDGMNKGIKVAKGKGILFLNACDYFVGKVLDKNINIPCLLPVKYINHFGNLANFKIRDYKYALPNCHQGILFENKKILYNTKYKISSDYDFYIKHNYKNTLKMHNTNAYIYYDRGYSLENYKLKEEEIANIIKNNFGYFYYYRFLIGQFIKELLKKFLSGIKGIYEKN